MFKIIAVFILLALAAIGLWLLANMRKTRQLARISEAQVPPNGKFAQISTGKLHYLEAGSGPDILLIHGLGGQLRSLSLGLMDRLSDRYHVVFIDRPGMGYSERPESASARIDDQAGYIEEVIDALGLDRPIVVGHSLGGAISCALALRAPAKVRALALVAPLLRPSTKDAGAFKALGITKPGMRRFIANTLAVPASAKNGDLTRDEIFGPDPVPPAYTIEGGGLLSLRPSSFINTSRDYVAVPEVIGAQAKRLDEITCPVRVIYGTEDRILDYNEQGQGTAEKHPHFRLTTVKGAGHMLPLTAPDAVVQMIDGLAAEVS